MAEKSEQPTPKKIEEARKRGEVAKSRDFTQTVLIVALFAYFIGDGAAIIVRMSILVGEPLGLLGVDFATQLPFMVASSMQTIAELLLPPLLIVIVLATFAEVVQTGPLLSFQAIKPSGKKLNVAANLKNMFSKKSLVEFLKSLAKLAVVSTVIYLAVHASLPTLLQVPRLGVDAFGAVLGALLRQLIIQTGLAYAVIALADFAWQKHTYTKGLMMSRQEVIDEYKTMEGNPEVKSQRRQLHREILAEDAVERARDASVLVVNPTHVAVALRYDAAKTPLPVVLAKAEGTVAERMIDAARHAGVPVMRDIALARALLARASVDQYIPSDLIEPVAAVLRLVQDLAAERGATDGRSDLR